MLVEIESEKEQKVQYHNLILGKRKFLGKSISKGEILHNVRKDQNCNIRKPTVGVTVMR